MVSGGGGGVLHRGRSVRGAKLSREISMHTKQVSHLLAVKNFH